ncbi:MAG: hypothetical protein O8C66_12560 [Candidatus Methanoperedens sp.]|nr:hypothetical protein [Candidatus Methanoperedens sp.]MCZ7371331.1 hypothetical protein [Candidatus Methanoperedens sp.]
MEKMNLEIIASVSSVIILIILITSSKLLLPASPGYGYTIAVLVFVTIMGLAGLKLAEMPDK